MLDNTIVLSMNSRVGGNVGDFVGVREGSIVGEIVGIGFKEIGGADKKSTSDRGLKFEPTIESVDFLKK